MRDPSRYEEPRSLYSRDAEELELFHGYEEETSYGQFDQEVAPAVVAAGAAIGTLGYTIVKDLFNSSSSGDVTWNLKRMDGTKFPDDDKETYGHIRGYREKSFSVQGKFIAGWIDEISATFEVVFSYNKYSVSNIYVQNTGVNDAVLWGLVVNQDIRKVDQVFYVGSRPVAAVDVKFHFHFSSPARDDILLKDYRLYGNGYWERTRHSWR